MTWRDMTQTPNVAAWEQWKCTTFMETDVSFGGDDDDDDVC